ncbi:T9SS type A sorting domain-containing protein [Arcicella aquatica]|uniref:T9SS type A sorting domain-containing protein n=1 Tax=Arcicella aquatica TaxID=217141 RepID=A0ABU5QIP0_9BACT|nr:T9SS type A sorting domain-containing protein [Arcicella aquatica]MEA5256709.1 T9SS type A sorting domain-containing protein [Arcicella aquatica]
MLFPKRILLLVLNLCIPTLLFCQIKITSPQNRAVYQRNQEGFSQITISGTYEKQIDKIEARLIPVEAGQGEYVDWTVIKVLPLNGNFSSVMRVKQGWYSLELRGSLYGTLIEGTTRLERVGVGEVFVIAGQSNAQGMPQIAGIGATNDRVNCFGSATNTDSGGDFYISLSPFSKLEANSRIAPRGMNGWCWGRLGDLLVNKLNVPVMFFNAAFEGTSSSTWATTANGNNAPNPYIGGTYQNKLPYQDLSDAFHYFVAQLGIRAVLWCQGESDNFLVNQKLATSSEVYRSNLQTIINKSRSDSGKDISWVVSLTSGGSATPCSGICGTPIVTDQNIINGQLAVINQANNNVFFGPNTDQIQVVGRQDGVHFNGVGLEQLANAWNNALNDNFFGNSRPHLPMTIGNLDFYCGSNQVDVNLPDGYSNYQWSNNGSNFSSGVFSSQKLTRLSVGTDKKYYARFRDNVGNVIQVPYISFVGSSVPSASITASSDVSFCDGNSVTLNASDAAIYEWSNGSIAKAINVSTSGSFAVRTVNQYGCQSDFSPTVTTTNKPLPPKPTIAASGPTTFCADTDVTLTSSNTQAGSYLWSTGTNSQNLRINTSGTYRVTTISPQGCSSPISDGVQIVVNPLPPTPTIVASGPTTFCADTDVTLTSSNVSANRYLWNTGTSTQNLRINTSGDYTVRTIDGNNCFSMTSAVQKITVNPLPATPTILSTKDTVFCDGDNTTLQMSLIAGNRPTWLASQNGTVTNFGIQNLTITQTGRFRAYQTDGNDCKSPISPTVFVSVKANPPRVDSIVRLSPYTVGVNAVRADQYVWQVNGVANNNLSGSSIRFTEEANLSVIAKNVYKTLFYGDKVCFSPVSNQYIFKFFNDNGVSIYPNPSNGVFKIEARDPWNNTTYEIYDLLGRFIQAGTISSLDTSRTMDLSGLAEGEYMLRLNADSLLIAKRIIINR